MSRAWLEELKGLFGTGRRTPRQAVLRSVLLAALIAGALYGLGLVTAGVQIPYLLEFAVVFALLLGWEIVTALRAPATAVRLLREETDVRAYELPDQPFVEVRRWENRLDWIVGDSERFVRTVVPAIAEVVDERLRLAHGLTRATDPDRAREIMGPRLWALITATQLRKAPSPRELAAAVSDLEEL